MAKREGPIVMANETIVRVFRSTNTIAKASKAACGFRRWCSQRKCSTSNGIPNRSRSKSSARATTGRAVEFKRRLTLAVARAAMLAVTISTADAQQKTPAEILAVAAEHGRETLQALRTFSYYAELTIETVSQSDTITGKYYRFSKISCAPDGTREEKILENTSTLPVDVHIGTNAANNLTRVYQFAITPETLSLYEVS